MFRRIFPPLVAADFLGTMLLPLSAEASSTPGGPSGSTSSSLPAGVVAIPMTAAVATAVKNLGNGTSGLIYSNGQTITVPTSVASKVVVHSGPTPDNTVYGNCGDSYLYLNKNGSTGVWGYVGYDVFASSVGGVLSFEFAVSTDNTTYSIGQTNVWDGPTSKLSWIQDFYENAGPGLYESHVITGHVIGWKNTCFSGDPNSRIMTP